MKTCILSKMSILALLVAPLALNQPILAGVAPPGHSYNVRDYGAVSDGVTLATAAIQMAIDSCAKTGGGTVYFPAGRFLSGTIYLKSNITLFLDAGAVLLGSKNVEDFPATVPQYRSYTDNYTDKSLIYAEKAENIGIMGRGVIDGQGASFPKQRLPYKDRPYLIRIVQCRNVMVKDITLQNSPMWVQHYLACENVTIDGISVHSEANLNNDGIDIDSCNKVRISNCKIYSGTDDGIVLKSTSGRVCENVTITNCIIRAKASGIKMGTESNGGFKNITISNCTVYDCGGDGLALELVDGGSFDRVNISNITMRNVERAAIFIRLGNRARPFLATSSGASSSDLWVEEGLEKPGIGSMSNITISNIQATGVSNIGCSITGLPGSPVENVILDNVRIRFTGGGTLEDAMRKVPENAKKYPKGNMFGTLPAYGFYCRHVKNLRFHNLDLSFEKEDHRPAVVCDDVDGLDIFGLGGESLQQGSPIIHFRDVRNALVHGCTVPSETGTFLSIEGERTEKINIIGNDLSRSGSAIEKGREVRRQEVFLSANHMPK